jgi:AraC-like DNA-binding protein
VSTNTTIKAIAYETGYTPSSVVTAIFSFAGTVAIPTFSPTGGSYTSSQTVTLNSTTPGASINYTIDGSIPSPGAYYGGPITVSSNMTINAIASKSGMTNSSIATAIYTVNTQNTVSAPYFSPAPSTFSSPPTMTVGTLTASASIRYTTDGSTPSPTVGTLYSSPFTISSTTTINAIAYESGMTNSAITTATYTINVTGQVAAPVLYPTPGQYTTAQTVTIMDDASAYSINYTTDGSDPSATSGTLYTGPFTITSTTTIKAIAIENKKTPSVITTGTYTINLEPAVASPVFSPAGGNFSSPQAVTISTSTPGASIRYTENGIAPTSATGTLYTGPITVTVSMPIMAIAYESGYNPSSVVTSAYTVTCASCPTIAPPTFSPLAGQFFAATPVTVTSSTPGATIYYTTDGSIPSATNGTIYTGPVTMQVPVNTNMTGMVTDASGVTMLKAVAINSSSMPSDVFTGIYTVIDPLRFPPANSLVLGLAHMAYNVSAANWNSMLSLWTNYLGFAVVEQTSTFALIKVNDQQFIQLYQIPSITAPQYQLANYGFYVTDVEAFRQQLAAAGVSVPASSTVNALGNLSFFTTDPDGHQDEWLQYLPNSVTGHALGQFMPSSELFGYIDDFGEASGNVTSSTAYFAQFGLTGDSNKVRLPNNNSYLEMLTYQTLNQTQFGKHQKTQLVNFRGHDVLTDTATLQARNPSILQVISEEGGVAEGTTLMPTHNCVDVYSLDLSRIRVIDLNY